MGTGRGKVGRIETSEAGGRNTQTAMDDTTPSSRTRYGSTQALSRPHVLCGTVRTPVCGIFSRTFQIPVYSERSVGPFSGLTSLDLAPSVRGSTPYVSRRSSSAVVVMVVQTEHAHYICWAATSVSEIVKEPSEAPASRPRPNNLLMGSGGHPEGGHQICMPS